MIAPHAIGASRASRKTRKALEGEASQGHTVGWVGPPYPAPSVAVPQSHLLLQVVKFHGLGLPGGPILLLPLQFPVEDV